MPNSNKKVIKGFLNRRAARLEIKINLEKETIENETK